MSFERVVETVLQCPGVLATAIADTDGIAVESWGAHKAQMDEMLAEYSTFLREVVSANRELQLGELEQLVVTGGSRVVLITLITGLYFLLTVVSRDGNAGKARFASRLVAHRLRHEFI